MTFLLTFLIGIIVSFYGVSVGGGGLLLVPVLVFLGLEAKEAIATATFANIITSGVGLYTFNHHKKIDLKLAGWASLDVGLGAILGSLILISLPEGLIKRVVGVVLIVMVVVSLFSRKVGLKRIKVGSLRKIIGHFALWLNGIYAGLIHSGSSILKTYILIYLFGQTYLESSGTRKLPSLVACSVSIVIFLNAGLIVYDLGVMLMIGHLIGSYLGANFALNKGEVWTKYAFTLVVGISTLKLVI